jgi:tetratricopeptide (TPR) repeat protein
MAALAAFLVVGCAAPWMHQSAVKYETIAANANRDTHTAKTKHAEALALLDKDREKHLAKVEKLLNEALVADVRYGPAHNTLGMVYYLEHKLYLAAWEFEYAAKLMPDHPQPYNNLGLVYEEAGKYDEAVTYYSMALVHKANDPQVTGNLVRTRMAMGERSPDLKNMLSDLALNHPDPGWQQWARDQVALVKFDDSSKTLDQPGAPLRSPEVLPAPIREEEDIKTPSGPSLIQPVSIDAVKS